MSPEMMFRMRFICICFSCALIACGDAKSDKTERPGEPDVYNVSDDDQAMNRAMETAVETIKTFDTAFTSGNAAYQKFFVKCKFDKPDGGAEYIWVNTISVKNGKYIGVVGNVPNEIPNLKVGDTIEVNNITDWMYIDNGVLRGGYTIRVLRNKMSAEEKAAFDAENGVRIAE